MKIYTRHGQQAQAQTGGLGEEERRESKLLRRREPNLNSKLAAVADREGRKMLFFTLSNEPTADDRWK